MKYIPTFASVSGFFAIWFFYPLLIQWNINSKVDLSAAFNPIYDFSVFFAGLLFTVYVIILSPTGGFMKAVIHSPAFVHFNRYLAQSIRINICVSIFSIYYIVTGFPQTINDVERVLISLWVGLVIYAAGCVLGVINIFLLLVRLQIKGKPRK